MITPLILHTAREAVRTALVDPAFKFAWNYTPDDRSATVADLVPRPCIRLTARRARCRWEFTVRDDKDGYVYARTRGTANVRLCLTPRRRYVTAVTYDTGAMRRGLS